MTNLEKMKQDVIDQIKQMNADQFHEFLELISGEYSKKRLQLVNYHTP